MNSFRVDELVLTFDELKPFSDVLHDEMQLIRLHRMYKSIDRHDDECLLRHVLCLVAIMENALRTDPPLVRSLQNNLIELTLLSEKAKSSVSKNYIRIAMGILFKYSAALLDVQQNSDNQVSFILYSLAYYHLCSVSSKDVLVSSWIAMHLLEVAAAIRRSDATKTQVTNLWRREDLAEYCVDALIPSEGCIQRLHSGVYREGITDCTTYWPTITEKQIQNLLSGVLPVLDRQEILRTLVWMIGHDDTFEEMAVFDDVLCKSLGNSNDLNSANLTSIDVKVFLFTLSLWSDSVSHPAVVPARLRIKLDHINCWNAVCQLISGVSHAGSVKSVLMRSRIMDSVRLRCRVICLRRLYRVFQWLEANVGDNSWLTLYASTITDTITRVHTYRRKSDELFPYDTDSDVEYTVDEVDRIEDHVSRYLASQLLIKKEFGEAERKLVYASSFESKSLLIKIYQAWLVDGNLEEHERDQVMKRVYDLKVSCERDVSPDRSPLSSDPARGKEVVSPMKESKKVLVDSYTNTPHRADNSTVSSFGDGDESFFSLKSERTLTSDRSFASAFASPVAMESHHKLLHEKNSGALSIHRDKGGVKMPSEQHEWKSTTVDNLTKSNNLSMTNTTQVVFSGKMQDLSMSGSTNEPQISSACTETGTSGIVTHNYSTQKNSVTSTANGFGGPATLSKPAFGQFIDKEAATSFWKGKSAGISVFGGQHAKVIASNPANTFGQHGLKNLSSTSLGFTRPQNNDLEQDNLPNVSTPSVSGKSQHSGLTLSNACTSEEYQDEDESFYNNLLMELCRMRIEGSCKEAELDSTDMESLQKKIVHIREQIRNSESQLHVNTKVPYVDLSPIVKVPEPTASELWRKNQHESLLKLEKKVSELMNSPPIRPESTSLYRPNTVEGLSAKPSSSVSGDVSCAGPMNLFRDPMSLSQSAECANLGKPLTKVVGSRETTVNVLESSSEVHPNVKPSPLLGIERLVRHPGSTDMCLGCMDDDTQDRALRILERLANEWNADNSDSD